MKYLLDTDIINYFLKGNLKVIESLNQKADLNNITTSLISYTELIYGAYYSSRVQFNLTRIQGFLEEIHIFPFCLESSHIFAKQKANLRKQGNIVDDFDLMIASIALRNHCILVTNNTKYFQRVKTLKLENWS